MDEDFVLVYKEEAHDKEDCASVSGSSSASALLVEDPLDRLALSREWHSQSDEEDEEHKVEAEAIAPSSEAPLAPEPEPAPPAPEPAPAAEEPKPAKSTPQLERAEVLDVSGSAKYTCHSCGCDIAAKADTIWEGYMGANRAAFLFKRVVNCTPVEEQRQQTLSTGTFLLQDVHCRFCQTPLGWTYLKAWNLEQKYKEGTTILQQTMLAKVEPNVDSLL